MIKTLRSLHTRTAKVTALSLGTYLLLYISLVIPLHMAAVGFPSSSHSSEIVESQAAGHSSHDFHTCQICHNSGTIHVLALTVPNFLWLEFVETMPATETAPVFSPVFSLPSSRAPPIAV